MILLVVIFESLMQWFSVAFYILTPLSVSGQKSAIPLNSSSTSSCWPVSQGFAYTSNYLVFFCYIWLPSLGLAGTPMQFLSEWHMEPQISVECLMTISYLQPSPVYEVRCSRFDKWYYLCNTSPYSPD